MIHQTYIETPIGTMVACATENGICLLEFSDREILETEYKDLTKYLDSPIASGDSKYFELLRSQLNEYFDGKRKEFSLPLIITGTEFQKKVWNELLKIPYGSTRSYKQQAIALNNIEGIRAVASANGANKIAIIIPCHRVIGANGKLTGYGGGLWRKQWLLELEGSDNKLKL